MAAMKKERKGKTGSQTRELRRVCAEGDAARE